MRLMDKSLTFSFIDNKGDFYEYTLYYEQGIVLKKKDSLLADIVFDEGDYRFSWVNPKELLLESHRKMILNYCPVFKAFCDLK